MSDIADRISSLKLELQEYGQKIVSHVEILHSSNTSKIPIDFKNDPRNAVVPFTHTHTHIHTHTHTHTGAHSYMHARTRTTHMHYTQNQSPSFFRLTIFILNSSV